MKNYKELFVDTFKESQIIDDTFTEIANNEGKAKGIEYLLSKHCEWLDAESFLILFTINQFTLKKPTVSMEELLNRLFKIDKVIEIKITDKDLIIELRNYTIEVEQFSKRNPQAIDIIPDLESIERNGTCYDKACQICLGHKGQAKIVTGYTYGYTDKSKFLHSWVEVTRDGADFVIDGTLNARINKEGYYKLRKVNVISEINKEDFIKDFERYNSFLNEIPLPVYYVFRDEIINELKKKDELFETSKTL